ncbi:lycopene beta-cyclase CrtY [Noviherbaspirillum pedocola]|nr:lycopene beta-cyclase CrtY [Noviherbaspirillum pedocola]
MHDLLLIGGGLANGLIAWRLKMRHPEMRILLVEKDGALGGNHTWSFYGDDLTPEQQAWIAPLVTHAWPAYEVRFPRHARRLECAYHSISSERFHQVLQDTLGADVLLDARVTDIAARSLRINGRRYEARALIDGRGHAPSPHLRVGYQKFLGQELVLAEPHGQALPIIMDATVPQHDGYRFVYTLPFDAKRILVEDTYYSDGPEQDPAHLRERIAAYARERGWKIDHVAREEVGVLPIALSGDIERFWESKPAGLPCSGLRAALFHATTGYSLPHAVRLADEIAAIEDIDEFASAALCARIRAHSTRQWHSQAYMRMLNRMLFHAAAPDERYRVLQRFYTLPAGLIARFYAARPTFLDQLRILSGKPPVPVLAAIKAIRSP